MTEHTSPNVAPPPAEALSRFELVFDRFRRTIGLGLGPLLFGLLLWLPPAGLAPAAARLAAVMGWVIAWWITEAVPIPVTAVLGPALAVVMGIAPVKSAFAPFGDPVIFLFLGGFILAEAMYQHGLDRRFALAILSRAWVTRSYGRVLAITCLISAGLSMWLSNSATTAMMYPLVLGILATIGQAESAGPGRMATGMLLGCAYGSSIGGCGTPVGTPPNLIALGQLQELAGIRISFFSWMVLVIPLTLMLLGICIWLLRSRYLPKGKLAAAGLEKLRREHARLGPWTAGQRNVLIAFLTAVTLWVTPGLVALAAGVDNPLGRALGRLLPESVVALLAAGLLFVLPVDWQARRFTITWQAAARIDWGTLLLFGGGLSLGGLMFETGLAKALGEGLVSWTGAGSLVSLTFIFSVFAIYFTEITSNTASAAMLVPLAIAAAQSAGVSPLEPALGCALGCSMAFMLPVATPPNAIVYGSGQIPITRMVSTGFWLNLVAACVIPSGVLLLVPLVERLFFSK